MLALSYLVLVHFEFSYDLNGHLASSPLQVYRSIDVAEGTVAHLLYESPSLQTRISRQLSFTGFLFGDNTCQFVVSYLLALGSSDDLLILPCCVRSGISCL